VPREVLAEAGPDPGRNSFAGSEWMWMWTGPDWTPRRSRSTARHRCRCPPDPTPAACDATGRRRPLWSVSLAGLPWVKPGTFPFGFSLFGFLTRLHGGYRSESEKGKPPSGPHCSLFSGRVDGNQSGLPSSSIKYGWGFRNIHTSLCCTLLILLYSHRFRFHFHLAHRIIVSCRADNDEASPAKLNTELRNVAAVNSSFPTFRLRLRMRRSQRAPMFCFDI